MKSAVFLDRDGVLNSNARPVNKPEDLLILPGVVEALQKLHEPGYELFVISNQGGVGRGRMTYADLVAVTQRFRELVCPTVPIQDIYYCIHAPEERCACRKPSPGMVYMAACEHGIDLSRSFFVGDMATDVLCARRAGVISILVGTGQPQHYEEARQVGPDYVASDLWAAADWIERYPWGEC